MRIRRWSFTECESEMLCGCLVHAISRCGADAALKQISSQFSSLLSSTRLYTRLLSYQLTEALQQLSTLPVSEDCPLLLPSVSSCWDIFYTIIEPPVALTRVVFFLTSHWHRLSSLLYDLPCTVICSTMMKLDQESANLSSILYTMVNCCQTDFLLKLHLNWHYAW